MPFDAGTIIARLELDEQGFDRKMADARKRAQDFEREPVKLKAGEVFTQADSARARKMFADLDNQISRDAVSRMRGSNGSVLGTLMSMFNPRQVSGAPTAQQAAEQGMLGKVLSAINGRGGGGGGGLPGGGGSGGSGNFVTRLLSGIGPQVLGLGARATLWTGLGGLGLGALPALAGGLAPLGIAGLGAGLIGAGASQLIGSKNVKGQAPTQGPLYDQATAAMKSIKAAFQAGASGLIKPLEQAFSAIPKLLHQLAPELKSVFAGAGTLIMPVINALGGAAKTILPLLAQAFRATAPLIGPLITGIGKLVSGILPGLITLLHAASPAVSALGGLFGTLGSGIGKMLAEFAPAIKASSVILTGLGKVLGGLFPIIGSLAGVFARTLAPIFLQFAQVLRALEPTLQIVGKVFAALAGAILTDLVSAFGALAKLLIDIQPAIQIFAKALSQAFTVLENSGVFAVLGDALEAIVPILAKLINAIAIQLAPILPVIITLISQLSTILIDLLAAGLTTILTGVVDLITHFRFLVPLLGILAAAWVAFDIAAAANPIGLIIIAIVALVGAVTLLVKHWKQVWGDIKNWAADAWSFIWDGFGKFLLPLLGPVGLIALGVIELAQHWQTVWGAIKGVAADFVQWIWNDFALKIIHFFTVDIPGGLRLLRDSAKIVWDEMEIAALEFVNAVIGTFAKLPGPLGAPFKAAHLDIQNELNKLLGDVQQNEQDIQNTWARLHGRSVALTFSLNLPAGVSFPSRPIKGHKAAGGGVGSAGYYLVGEQGPELTWLPSGSHVMPAGPTAKILGGMASGTAGWDVTDAFSPRVPVFLSQLTTAFSAAEKAINAAVQKNAVFSGGGAFGFPGGGSTGPGAAAAQRYAASILHLYGWGPQQMPPLIALWNQESGWNYLATNPSSGAYGIPQSLPADKMAAAGPDWRTNPATQIRWGLGYIRSAYGSPAGAEAHELAYHWYDKGGWLPPGPVNGTGRREAVLNPSQSEAFLALAEATRVAAQGGGSSRLEALIERLITAVDRNAVTTGAAVSGALRGAARRAFYNSQYQTGGA